MAIWHCCQYEIMIPTSTHLSPDFPACDNGCILTWTGTAAESVATERGQLLSRFRGHWNNCVGVDTYILSLKGLRTLICSFMPSCPKTMSTVVCSEGPGVYTSVHWSYSLGTWNLLGTHLFSLLLHYMYDETYFTTVVYDVATKFFKIDPLSNLFMSRFLRRIESFISKNLDYTTLKAKLLYYWKFDIFDNTTSWLNKCAV